MLNVNYPKEQKFFKKLMKTINLNQVQMANLLNIKIQIFNKYYHGLFLPSPKYTSIIIKALHMPCKQFMLDIGMPFANSHFGTALKILLYKKGLTQQKVSKALGLKSGRSIANFEFQHCSERDQTIFKISDALNINPVYFAKAIYEDKYHIKPDKNNHGYLLMKLRYAQKIILPTTKNVSTEHFLALEKNDVRPTIKTVFKLAKFYKMNLSTLLNWYGYNPGYQNTQGGHLFKIMLKKNMSASEIGRKAGVSRQMVSNYIRNINTVPVRVWSIVA